jgi:broad specificity phosphatase PhoE
MLTIELIAHVDAGDRRTWGSDQDERPLSELGRLQAKRFTELLAVAPVDSLFSSPALRCRQTIEQLAVRFGLEIGVLPGLAESNGFATAAGWGEIHRPREAFGGAQAAGRAFAAFRQIRRSREDGRIVVCSHGDVVPVLAAFLSATYELALPEPGLRPIWFTFQFEGEACHGWLVHPPDDFPRSAL